MGLQHYDAIIIGAGQAGNPLALAFAETGMRVALIERDHVGGTCINVGCTPSKTMIASAHAAHLARRAAQYGISASLVSTDLWRVRERTRAIVQRFREGEEQRLRDAPGLSLVRGQAAFESPRSVVVRLRDGGLRRLSADKIFINTGARPKLVDLSGQSGIPFLDSTSVMELDRLPEHLLILGGSYIGLEFAQMFRRFGSLVTIVESGAQFLPREDRDVADSLAEILREDGIDLHIEAKATRVREIAGQKIELELDLPRGGSTLEGTHLLVATGRTPNTETLDLDAAGIERDERGYILVNEKLETSASGVYALGEVNGGPAFTHVAYDDFRVVRANLLENGRATNAARTPCYTLFTDPELGRVGLTETEAREQGKNIRVAVLLMSHVARAIESEETRGFIKVVVDAGTNQILGAAVLAWEGGELAGVLQVAMMGGLPYTALRDGMFAHPTLAESLNNLFTAMDASETKVEIPALEKEHFA
jgi:pyruvate/2-oxoglutarate dehydrogenase complex dihydrolipoamide dehydrogenase (E3) component